MTNQNNTTSEFAFSFNPEPRTAHVDLTQGNFVEIVIVVQNLSGRPVGVHPILVPVGSVSALNGEPLSPVEWMPWISLKEASPELDFEPGGEHRFNVLISLPPYTSLGSYQFQLVLSGVENPDEEFAASDPITFTVTGPKMDMRPFAIGSAIILALVILGIIAAVLFIRPHPSLEATLTAPQNAVQGSLITYTVNVENLAAEPARNVMIDYRLPDSMLAATAYVPDEIVRHCDVLDRSIRCDLGNLSKTESISVDFLAVPGPAAVTITNTLAITISADTIKPFPVVPAASQMITHVSSAPGKFAVALLPSTSSPLLGENFTYQVLAWSTVTTTQTLTFTFSLPPGMKYVKYADKISDLDCRPLPNNNVDVVCPIGELPFAKSNMDVTPHNLHVQAAGPTASPARLTASSDLSSTLPLTVTATTKVIDSALHFNGIDDWAELGYNQMPKNFTVEMWVHPYSSDDGQSFAGLHRVEPDGTVSNLFLVGYWFGSLQVNVKGTSYNLVTPKRTDPYHLAVVVKEAGNDSSKVNVYVNGEPQEWQQPETRDCGPDKFCKFFISSVPGVQNALPWVLGQDWDSGNLGKKTSDFFHGTLAEVRIWSEARSINQILDTYQVRPRGDEKNLVAYYRLEPTDLEGDTLPSRVASAQPGTRMGATWIEPAPSYGMALQFSGPDQTLTVPGLQMDKLNADSSGQVDLTLAGWIKVDEIPTRQEWILGFVPTGTLTSIATTDQVALASARQELRAAQQAADELKLDASRLIFNSSTARQSLFLSLVSLSNNNYFKTQTGESIALRTDLSLAGTDPLPMSGSDLDGLVRSNPEIASYASPVKNKIDHYNAYKLKYDALTKVTSGTQPTTTLETTSVELQMLQILLVDEKIQFYDNLQRLSSEPIHNQDQASITAQDKMKLALISLEKQPIARIKQELQGLPTYPILVSLARLDRLEQDLAIATSAGNQTNNENLIIAFQNLKSAQEALRSAEIEFDSWIQTERQKILSGGNVVVPESDQAYLSHLDATQYNLQRYQAAQTDLINYHASQARIDAAQARVNQSSTPQPAVSAPWTGLMIDCDGYVMLVVRPANGGDIIWKKDTKPLQPGKWVHYAAVIRYDPHNGNVSTDILYPPDSQGHTNNLPFLYRDGSLVKGNVDVEPSLVAMSDIQCPDGFYLGGLCESGRNFYFAGQLDEVRIWNRALTAYKNVNEIDTWRKLPGIASDEIAYWAFDDGPGNQTRNLSRDSSFDLNVQGPGWIEADVGLPTERP